MIPSFSNRLSFSQQAGQIQRERVATLRRLVKACAFGATAIALSLASANVASGQTATTTSVTSSLNPAAFGQTVTFTATITPQGAGTPTGTVTFQVGCQTLNSLIQQLQVALGSNGQAQFTFATTGTTYGCVFFGGSSLIVAARYSGDANFAPSNGTIGQVVSAPPTPVSITVTPASEVLILGGNSQQYTATGNYANGTSLNLTSLASWTSSNPAVATINDNSNLPANGFATTATAAGSTTITATYYSGDNGFFTASAVLGVVEPGANVLFLGGGSSATFLELGQAAQSSAITASPCVWTQERSGAVFVTDKRPFVDSLPVIDDYGDIWITWSPGAGTCASPAGNFNIYSYMSLDSVVGLRCYFETDASGTPGCVQNLTIPAGTAGQNLLCNGLTLCGYGPDTPLPQAVISALSLQHWFAAATEILPADAKFVTFRMLQPCGQTVWRQAFDQGLRQNYGLGYLGAAEGIGAPVQSYFSQNSFNTLDFNFSGRDPINGAMTVPAYSVYALGVKPILVAVSPAGDTGLGAATDIPSLTLALFTDGTLGRSTDLLGPTATYPVTTLINEPLSGAYNVLEYSVPNSSQFHTSQDANNCSGSGVYSNPLNLQSANGQIPAYRLRALGSSEMISQLQAGTTSSPRLGYFFWSAPNASAFTESNGKYLTVDGVDPLLNTYTDGVLPGVDAAHPLSNVTFTGLNAGDYPIWSVMRIVSQSPEPIGVANLILAAQGVNASQPNFIAPANLQVWHSHYYLPALDLGVASNGTTIYTPNDLCPYSSLAETGGDAGGANTLKQVNADFCADFGNASGLINKSN
jgi:uncharacterized protein YjdB